MRILALHCTNTRQTTRALDALLADVEARDDTEVVHWALSDGVTYPFPWGFAHFFSLMPACVRGRTAPLQPPPPEVTGPFDLVVLAWPVWFLSPALPVAAFLASDHAARLLRDTPVISLVTCRNMAFNAALEVHARIRALGGRLLDVVQLMDRAPPWTTFITTPVWLLTGRKQIGNLPEAGIQPADFDGLAPLARRLADGVERGVLDEPLFAGCAPIALQARYLFPELVLKRVVFRPWALLIGTLGELLPPLRRPLGLLVFLGILASVLLLIPLLLVTRILLMLLARPWLEGLEERALQPYGRARHGAPAAD